MQTRVMSHFLPAPGAKVSCVRVDVPHHAASITSRSTGVHNARAAATQCSAGPNFEPYASNDLGVERIDAAQLFTLLKSKRTEPREGPGEVHLVGTGPGDPGLLTLRAVQLMQSADVVLYDRLVSDDILRLVHGGARMVYVGKQMGFHTATQTQIHEMLCEFAQQGHTVLRLKGGDPFIFGRGGEEVQYLEERGICVHTIPGITAGAGICAELGIPMTHRGLATSVRFLTGHSRAAGEAQLDESIAAASDPHTTLIVYMGLKMLPTLTEQLTAAGMDRRIPAVAVERGTTAEQRPVYAPLEELQAEVAAHKLESPTLLIIGEVVAMSAGWREYQRTSDSLQRPANLQRPIPLREAGLVSQNNALGTAVR